MRKSKNTNGIIVNAIAGTHVIFFGLDLQSNYRTGFRGFAFRRKDHSTGEITWLRGLKTFETTEPHPASGENFSTQEHPIQGFQWADYSVHPGTDYTYTIVCMYGDPAALDERREVDISITTELETGSTHSVFFNRGSVATQEYARRFLNKPPNVAGPGAYEWLSRGLMEAMIAFIERAKSGDSIHGAVYEFQWPAILNALRQAHLRGVTIDVIYDEVEKTDSDGDAVGPWENNIKAVDDAQIKSHCKGRRNARLMHNKFLVLSKGNNPKSVWTGSTNLTENGIFGHSNLGHIVDDAAVARAFKDYWDRLDDDPEVGKDFRDANMQASPVPAAFNNGTTCIFSPRGTALDALEWYAQIAGTAQDALFMTFAFGMHEKFKQVYNLNDSVLRMALMEKAYAAPSVKARDEEDIKQLRKLPNTVVALGNRIVTNAFDRWLKEMYSVDGKGKHVYWVHTKYMLVDPLGSAPVVISGSANFSKASTDSNDENMLIIKGDKRIADIYFGEYMRLYTHYAFREAVKWAMEKAAAGQPQDWKPQFLDETDNWMKDYFNSADKTGRYARRKYFAGPMSL